MSVPNLNEAVVKLKAKNSAIKDLTSMGKEGEASIGRANRLREFKDKLNAISFEAKEAFYLNSTPILVETKVDNKEALLKRLNTLGIFTVDTFIVSEKITDSIYRNTSLERGLHISQVPRISQELKTALIEVTDGRNVPSILGLGRTKGLRNKFELVTEVYRLLERAHADEGKNLERNLFLYSTQGLTGYLLSQDTITAKNKIMVVLVPEVNQRWIQLVQSTTNKAVSKITNSDPDNVATQLKKLFKTETKSE